MAKKSNTNKGQWCRIFNETARLGGDFILRDTQLRVKDVLRLLDQQKSYDEILAIYPELSARDIDLCYSVAVHHMPNRPEYSRNKGGLKMLVDENISHSIIPSFLCREAELSHLSYHGLTSSMDEDIYDYARKNGFEVIVTGDNDFISLTNIEVMRKLAELKDFDAVDAWMQNLPFVTLVSQQLFHDEGKGEGKGGGLKARLQNIIVEAKKKPRRMASLSISEKGVKSGMNARQTYAHFMRGTAKGFMPSKPVFDKAFLDVNMLNTLCQNFNRPFFETTAKAENYVLLKRLKAKSQTNTPPRL